MKLDEEGSMKVGLCKEDARCRFNWIVDINLIVTSLR